MSRLLLNAIAFGLVVHGLIHLMGLVAYWPLGTIVELPYKTALLNGRWEVGQMGMRLFSVLWLAATLGFLLSALGLDLVASSPAGLTAALSCGHGAGLAGGVPRCCD